MRLTCILLTAALLVFAPVATYAAELAQTIPTPASQASAAQATAQANRIA